MAPFDLDACIEKLKKKQLLGEALLREICEKTKEVLMRESNVVHVSSPVTVVGDIHGQFHDLIEIFRIGGAPPDTNYLFLGMSPLLNIGDKLMSRRLCRSWITFGGDDIALNLSKIEISREGSIDKRESRIEGSHSGKLNLCFFTLPKELRSLVGEHMMKTIKRGL